MIPLVQSSQKAFAFMDSHLGTFVKPVSVDPNLYIFDLTDSTHWGFGAAASMDTSGQKIDANFQASCNSVDGRFFLDLEAVVGAEINQDNFDFRFKFKSTDGTDVGCYNIPQMMFSNVNTEFGIVNNALGAYLDNDAYSCTATDGTIPAATGSPTSLVFDTDTNYLFEVKLRGGDTLTITYFGETDFSSAVSTHSISGTAVTNALTETMKYFICGGYQLTCAGSPAFPVDFEANIEFYNGVRP